ncbi:MlaD family protein [Tropicimonas sp. IMCC34011]|uniref:MlaD family protein n=1 Tax=Tropicimonas sp. IMCC34011 TaxID=2248759 RepID=UPI0018E4E8B1|nr:MlaD family protein [Tropicimonas sp. IMCC34011]
MTDRDIPQTETKPVRRSIWERVSVVWVVPFGALVISLAIAWNNYQSRGPLIEVTFQNASGIVEGETELRYRDVAVGVVEEVGFTYDLARVNVTIRVDNDVADYIDESAVFWVVRPEVTAQGVSGLSTVLSGVYIEGSWDQEAQGAGYRFEGLERTPVARPDQEGLRFVLRAEPGESISGGTSILYKGLEVGRVGEPRIAEDGVTVLADAFVAAPHNRLVTSQTRFWDTSGFTFSIGPGGAEVDFESVGALISGGISFETAVSGGQPIEDGEVFSLFPTQSDAMNSLFSRSDGDNLIQVAVVFEDNVSGLSAEAPVVLNGLQIGQVDNLTGLVDPERFGDEQVRLVATLSIRAEQLGLAGSSDSREEVLDFLADRVDAGLRARLINGSILTGGLKVELAVIDDAEPAAFDPEGEPFPVLPTVASDVRDVAATAEGVFTRINNLPIEELLGAAIRVMDNAATLIGSEDTQRIPGEAAGLIADVRGVVSSEEIQELPERIGAAVADVQAILAQIEAEEGISRILAAVDSAGEAADGIAVVAEGVPEVLAGIEAVTAKVNELDLETLIAEANGVVASAGRILGGEAAQAIPASLSAALDSVQSAATEATGVLAEADTTLASLNESEAASRLVAALDAAEAAARDVGASLEGVPELVDQIGAVAAKAEALDIESLLASATDLSRSADTLLSDSSTIALPGNLTRSLGSLDLAVNEVTEALRDINEQQAVSRLVTALEDAGTAASTAATDVSSAVEGVPDLVAEIQAVAAKANSLAVEQLIAEVTGLVDSADALIGTEDARALPASLNGALDQLNLALQELREGGTVENVNATLASARGAANSIAGAADQLPALVNRIGSLLAQAEGTLSVYGENGNLNRDARAALREVSQAAAAVSSLARAIERRPNSLLTGR